MGAALLQPGSSQRPHHDLNRRFVGPSIFNERKLKFLWNDVLGDSRKVKRQAFSRANTPDPSVERCLATPTMPQSSSGLVNVAFHHDSVDTSQEASTHTMRTKQVSNHDPVRAVYLISHGLVTISTRQMDRQVTWKSAMVALALVRSGDTNVIELHHSRRLGL